MLRAIALLAGPALAAAILFMPPPDGLTGPGLAVGAVAVLMAIWCCFHRSASPPSTLPRGPTRTR
jgi:peptidoglycan/LPS O-acetylase OafA/YrhL